MGETRDGREFGTNELPSKDAHIAAIEADLAALRARSETVEWVRDDAIATIKLLQQQLKFQNDSFVARLSAAPVVKPLEWIGNKASSPVGQYMVKKMGGEWLAFKDGWTIHGSVLAAFVSEEAAKAAVQADFERRILPALVAQTGTVTEIAEIIYRAYGFDPAGKTETADGTPYGEWAKAVEAARQLAAALTCYDRSEPSDMDECAG